MTTKIKVQPQTAIYDTLLIGGVNIAYGEGYVMAALQSADTDCVITYNVKITPEEYNLWGTDDTYIEDLILSKIGLVRA